MRGGMAWVALVSLLVSGWARAALAESADDINRLIDAAKHGSNPALYRLGYYYMYGIGVTRNFARSNQYYEQAALAGYVPAQNNVGYAYHEGIGGPKDMQKAMVWFRMAARQGNALALMNLGEMYRDGEGVPQDKTIAYELMVLCAAQELNQPSSEAGVDSAILECRRDLGKKELERTGSKPDFRYAAMFFQLAQQPNRDYASGSGVAYDRAVKTMREAKQLYDATYPKLDAQAATWVRNAVNNQPELLAILRKKAAGTKGLR